MLEIKNISKTIKNKKILSNVSLAVENGQTLAIVGPSGAGKTTLLRIIAGLEPLEQGTIVLDGQDVTSKVATQIDGKVAVVFQDFNLFPQYTALENVALSLKLVKGQDKNMANQNAQKILDQLGLEGQINNYPFELSGGQKQRVAIARALALNPEIILFDERTSALDPALSSNVADLINSLKNKQITQIVVTHDMEFAQKVADVTFTLEAIK